MGFFEDFLKRPKEALGVISLSEFTSPLDRFKDPEEGEEGFDVPDFLKPNKLFAAIKRQPQSFISPVVFGTDRQGVFGGYSPRGDPGADDVKFTGTARQQELARYALSSGINNVMDAVREAMAPGGGGMTPELLETLSQASYAMGSLYNGTNDESSQAAIATLNYITSVSEDDVGTGEFYENFARFGSKLPKPGESVEDNAMADALAEQQQLALEAQRIETLTAQRNYEREGVMSVIQMLPSAARIQFMSQLFRIPKFSQMFFGDFDQGTNDGPYIGGVLNRGFGGSIPSGQVQPARIQTLSSPVIDATPAGRGRVPYRIPNN